MEMLQIWGIDFFPGQQKGRCLWLGDISIKRHPQDGGIDLVTVYIVDNKANLPNCDPSKNQFLGYVCERNNVSQIKSAYKKLIKTLIKDEPINCFKYVVKPYSARHAGYDKRKFKPFALVQKECFL